MDIRLKDYSHAIITKIIAFIIVIVCFTGAIISFLDIVQFQRGYFEIILEDNYYSSRRYQNESGNILGILTRLIEEYKNEELILNGGTISEDEIRIEEENLYWEFQYNAKDYNHKLSEDENYEKFLEVYGERIAQIRDQLIRNDLKEYNLLLQRLGEYNGVKYFASDGVNVFTNSIKTDKEYFKSFPSYMIFDQYEKESYPKEIVVNNNYYLTKAFYELNENNAIYISFAEEFLNPQIKEWKDNKVVVTRGIYRIIGFLLGLVLSFIYLVLIIGRESFKDKDVHLNFIDKLYNEFNLGLCIGLIVLWFVSLEAVYIYNMQSMRIPITALIATFGLVLVLSLVKHIKNRTIIKHTLIYRCFYRLFKFVQEVYESGSVGVKIVLIVIGYPILVALTFFMFPITMGVAAWLALKRVKEFNEIKEGVEKIKAGEIHHTINVSGNGEFGRLGNNINSIADGLNKAVDNQLKSERLKTELITNVSHDIRTPLTSIITYVDLLKKERDQSKIEGYIEILEQKSQRLKILTDDLFEAAKASSGNIPVNLEQIDIVSLITQGLGELNDKVEALELKFKMNHPKDKVYVVADGKLFWRAIENLLSNIFKYALQGSRIYIDIETVDTEVVIIIKNISAYELNISADELMERFKRGDESRSSQGSGLGLSITKSLINVQRGRFNVEIDGDLFKAIIHMPRYKNRKEL